MRWWYEFNNPSLKCERLGHKEKVEQRRVYAKPESSWGSVADKVLKERTVCRRCKQEIAPWKDKRRSYITSLSMPDEMWDVFYEKGEVEC